MNIEQILDSWTKDCVVDKTELADESLRTISLHSKYIRLYKIEKLKLIKLLKEYPKLKLAKHEFYSMGPSKETQELGWEMPARGAIIKTEVDMYLQADQDIINANLRISYAQEKVDLLADIVKEVNNRRWSIRAAIDFQKWIGGS
jgi:hypothetical protein